MLNFSLHALLGCLLCVGHSLWPVVLGTITAPPPRAQGDQGLECVHNLLEAQDDYRELRRCGRGEHDAHGCQGL